MIYGLLITAAVVVGLLVLLRSRGGKTTASPPVAAAKRSVRTREMIEAPPEDPPAAAAADDPETPEILREFHLLRGSELDAAARARVGGICAAMPEPHPVQTRLARGLDTPEELMAAVVSDAGLTATILRTVNSAAFGLSTSITSVQHAINYLGVSVVKGVVSQAALAERAEAGTPEQQRALACVWKSACVASAFAQLLGTELGFARPSVLATKSLFFNLGDVALILAVEGIEDAYDEGVGIVERVQRQQALAGVNTAVVGSALAEAWSLPAELVAAIETGLIPLATAPAEHPMDGAMRQENIVLYLAGRIGDRATYRGLRDVAELPLGNPEEPGTFFLHGHLVAAGLERVPALLDDASFRRKANRMIGTLAG